jgi:DNA-binding NarL/FixJ family response regulator
VSNQTPPSRRETRTANDSNRGDAVKTIKEKSDGVNTESEALDQIRIRITIMKKEEENVLLSELWDKVVRLEAQVELLTRMVSGGAEPPREAKPDANDSAVSFLMSHTPKQHAVMQMLRAGYGTDRMAEALDVTESTIKVHVRGVMQKHGLKTRAQIVMLAARAASAVSEAEYEALSGLPMDWVERPSHYADVTNMLRTKSR